MLGWLRQAGNLFQDYAAIHVTGMILAGDPGHVDVFKMCVSVCTSLVIFIFLPIMKVRKGQCRTGIEHREGQTQATSPLSTWPRLSYVCVNLFTVKPSGYFLHHLVIIVQGRKPFKCVSVGKPGRSAGGRGCALLQDLLLPFL